MLGSELKGAELRQLTFPLKLRIGAPIRILTDVVRLIDFKDIFIHRPGITNGFTGHDSTFAAVAVAPPKLFRAGSTPSCFYPELEER
jgi:hypothetical protein